MWWADEDADYIRGRSTRYLGALNVEPAWTQEVMADEHLVELSPYPSSRVRALGFLGYSPSAGRVLVVIAYRDLDGELHGMNAWPASGRDLTTYQKAVKDDEGRLMSRPCARHEKMPVLSKSKLMPRTHTRLARRSADRTARAGCSTSG